jgi:hypothetical protein
METVAKRICNHLIDLNLLVDESVEEEDDDVDELPIEEVEQPESLPFEPVEEATGSRAKFTMTFRDVQDTIKTVDSRQFKTVCRNMARGI